MVSGLAGILTVRGIPPTVPIVDVVFHARVGALLLNAYVVSVPVTVIFLLAALTDTEPEPSISKLSVFPEAATVVPLATTLLNAF